MNYFNNYDNPNLIDSNTKNFITNNLKSCHNTRVSYYSYILNCSILFTFILVVSVTLYYLSYYKRSKEEINEKMHKDQEYVLEKIKYYKEVNKKDKSMITELPTAPSNVPVFNLPHL